MLFDASTRGGSGGVAEEWKRISSGTSISDVDECEEKKRKKKKKKKQE